MINEARKEHFIYKLSLLLQYANEARQGLNNRDSTYEEWNTHYECVATYRKEYEIWRKLAYGWE